MGIKPVSRMTLVARLGFCLFVAVAWLSIIGKIMPQIEGNLQEFFDSKSRADYSFVSDFENVSDWTVLQGGIGADTTNFKEGTQGIKWNCTSGRWATADLNIDLNASNSHFHIWCYIDNITNFEKMDFYFRGEPTSEYFWWGISPNDVHIKEGWNKIPVNPASSIPYGGAQPSEWETLTKIRISVKAKTDKIVFVTFDDFRIIPNRFTARVTLRFDDAYESCYTNAKPEMDVYGYAGVQMVATAHIGDPYYQDRMTVAQLRELQNAGWDIASHTKTHKDLASCCESELEEELGDSQKWLLNNGFVLGSRFIGYAGNSWNDTVICYTCKYYLAAGARIGKQENLPPANEYALYTNGVINTTALSIVESWINNCSIYNSWLILEFHKVLPIANETYSTSTSDFKSILGCINSKGIPVLTYSQVIDELIGISAPEIKLFGSTHDITAIEYGSEILILTVSAPSETTSTSKVCCGNKGKPTAVHATNGTLTWSYNASTTVLTLNVTHASPTRIMVYWKFPGDVDSDVDVDANDLYLFAIAYGSVSENPTYDSDADIDGDDDVDSDDLYILAENYGRT